MFWNCELNRPSDAAAAAADDDDDDGCYVECCWMMRHVLAV